MEGSEALVSDSSARDSPGDVLTEFAAALGLAVTNWGDLETESSIFLERNVERATLDTLDVSVATLFATHYGSGGTLSIYLDDWAIFSSTARDLNDELAAMRTRLGGHTSARLELTIDKNKLADEWYGPSGGEHRVLYIFASAARRQLSDSLERFEQVFFPPAHDRCSLLLPALDVQLAGPHLRLIGARGAGLPFPSSTVDVRLAYTQCRQRTRWQEGWLDRLTPFHVEIAGPADSGGIATALRSQLARLTHLYTADSTAVDAAGNWIFTYQSSREQVQVSAPAHADEAEVSADTVQLAHWAYDSGLSADRFAVLQSTMITELRALPEQVRFAEMDRRAASIVSQLNWHLQALVDNRLDEYSKQVRDLEDYIDKTVNAFTDQVATLLKSVSDTVLAAVGVFFASLVAATFKDSFNGAVFALSMLAFAGYIRLFPHHFGLALQKERRSVLEADYTQRRVRFSNVLYAGKVSQIEGNRMTDAFGAFDRAYNQAENTFIALELCSIIAAVIAGALLLAGTPLPLAPGPTSTVVQPLTVTASPMPTMQLP